MLPERFQGFAWFYVSGPWFRWAPPLLVAVLGLFTALARLRRATPTDRALLVTALATTPALQLEARGTYDRATNTFTAISVSVVL